MHLHRQRAAAAVAVFLVALAASPADAQSASEAELARRLDQLAAELASVKAELARMQRERASAAVAPPQQTPGTTAVGAPTAAPLASSGADAAAAQGNGLALGPATVLTSYGEIHYNRPTHDSKNAVADLTRFVLGFQHRFDDRTKLVTELEVEHAVSSADDRGEV